MDNNLIKILIIDDVEANLLSFTAILEHEGLEIHQANSGNTGLKILLKNDIDIVLLDVQMPDMNGFEVAELMRDNPKTCNIPIIFITAINKDENHAFRGFNLGAVDYLYKPISSKLLKSKVNVFVKLQLQSRIIETKTRELEEKIKLLEEAEKELYKLSRHDRLTGIYNRMAFDEMFDIEWKRAIRFKNNISLLMIDIDHFKMFNDTYGHLEGDKCLKAVTGSISTVLKRSTDNIFRFGGEEFIVLLPEIDTSECESIAEVIRKNIETLETDKPVTVSIGVASIIPNMNDSSDSLVKKADDALYTAKKQGRNRTVTFLKSDNS